MSDSERLASVTRSGLRVYSASDPTRDDGARPTPQGRPHRICLFPGCDTILSIYNRDPEQMCYVHGYPIFTERNWVARQDTVWESHGSRAMKARGCECPICTGKEYPR